MVGARGSFVEAANFIFLKKNIESMASVSLQPRHKRDIWLWVMTEAKRDVFWPRFNMPRFLNRSRISKITGVKRGYCTSVGRMYIQKYVLSSSILKLYSIRFSCKI